MSHSPSHLLLLLVILAFLEGTAAQMAFSGDCPPVNPMASFEVSRFLGRWYELQRSTVLSQNLAGRCWTTDYQFTFPRGFFTTVTWVGLLGTTPSLENDIVFDITFPGRVSYDAAPPLFPFFKGEYWILDTDYDNYALIWQCHETITGHSEIGWFLVRDLANPPANVEAIKNRRLISPSACGEVTLLPMT